MPRTLYDKIWDEHVVHTEDDGTSVHSQRARGRFAADGKYLRIVRRKRIVGQIEKAIIGRT